MNINIPDLPHKYEFSGGDGLNGLQDIFQSTMIAFENCFRMEMAKFENHFKKEFEKLEIDK